MEIVLAGCNFEVRPTKKTVRVPHKNTSNKLIRRLFPQRSRQLKALRARLHRRDEKIERLEEELKSLKSRYEPQMLPNHTYPLQMIALAIFIVVHAKGSLRCAAKTTGFFARMMGWEFSSPVHATVDNWVRRLGLYVLQYSEDKVGCYVGIIDESIQIGREKLLLLLGCLQFKNQRRCQPLNFDDVEILGLQVARSWKSAEVEHFLDRCKQQPGVKIDYVICDGGSNLNKALTAKGITVVADFSHLMMNALKKLLKGYAPLSRLTKFMGKYRQYHLMGQCSVLCPPTLRDKDRFLRLFAVVDWLDRLQACRSFMSSKQRKSISYLSTPNVLLLLRQLRQLRAIVSMSSKILKSAGISPSSQKRWKCALKEFEKTNLLTDMSRQLVEVVNNYFSDHLPLIGERDRLLCCSDIIESMFGHYKNKGGMKVISSDVLYLPLLSHDITLELVAKGLGKVSQNAVDSWHQQNTCPTRYSQLKAFKSHAQQATARA